MNISPSLNNKRSLASDKFSTLRTRALRDAFMAKFIGKNLKLEAFPEHIQRDRPNRKLVGVKDIHIHQIIGTLNRDCDFDSKFRPLGKHLLERWVNILANLDPDGWEPILVHKIDEKYYVEDGHHRVSVARSNGMIFIQAKVWEYPREQKKTKKCMPVQCTERTPTKVKTSQRVTG